GNVISVWDRKSMKKDPVTGRDVPDETKRVPLLTYKNPRPAEWPAADYVVGNPPFLGNKRMRDGFGDGYVEALRLAYSAMPESADFVLYWWHKAAMLVRAGEAKRFGFITTNSLRQTFARRVVQAQLGAQPALSLAFAIPDHPWVDTVDGAAVRIAMTVGVLGDHPGELLEVANEQPQGDGSRTVTFTSRPGKILSDLTIGANVSAVIDLRANRGICFKGVILVGEGFRLSPDLAETLRARLGSISPVMRRHFSGKDLINGDRGNWVIDLFGYDDEALVRQQHPELYQHLSTTVRPERMQNREKSRRDRWWLFGRSNETLRAALKGLPRYIATVETSKYKLFAFVPGYFCPDHKLYVIASDDAFNLGILSSRVHVAYALAAGGTLEDRPTWTNTTCFLPFPFPGCGAEAQASIRKLAEELDAHRKRAQSLHPGLTLTGMYNVLEKLRANEALNAKEKQIHDAGLVSVLRQLHDNLDAAVFAAYGWPPPLTDAEILERLVALNAERAKEEASGLVRWLRPDYQNPGGTQTQQTALAVEVEPNAKPGEQRAGKQAWPRTLAERVKAVSTALAAVKEPATAAEIAKRFARARTADVGEILETLCAMGKARRGNTDETYLP
ncbi:MAG: class I SAM-dependent DNA methyltransferase, partial [Verrucomicrobia bacterium]|nr:class I SAM-dependent DNA methyltransferase [Verrucomicrobiota bacterium]